MERVLSAESRIISANQNKANKTNLWLRSRKGKADLQRGEEPTDGIQMGLCKLGQPLLAKGCVTHNLLQEVAQHNDGIGEQTAFQLRPADKVVREKPQKGIKTPVQKSMSDTGPEIAPGKAQQRKPPRTKPQQVLTRLAAGQP